MRQLRGAGAAGLGDRDDDVDLVGRHGRDDTLGQRLAQIQTRLVDRDAVEHRVGPGQVDEFKNAGLELGVFGALLGMHLALHVHKDGFTGRDVALELVRGAFKRHGFAGHHDGAALLVLAAA